MTFKGLGGKRGEKELRSDKNDPYEVKLEVYHGWQ